MELPAAYILLKHGYEPYVAMLPVLITQPLCLLFRFYILKRNKSSFSYSYYFLGIIIRSLIVFAVGLLASYCTVKILPQGFIWLLINIVLSVIEYMALILFLGFNKKERAWLFDFFRRSILKR